MIVGIGLFVTWSIVDFNGMFNFLHSLFFADGSWLFNAKSLLIIIYPTAFWICMGVICGAISIAASIILIILGKIIK